MLASGKHTSAKVSAEQADGGDVAEKCYDFALDFGEYEGHAAQPLSQKSKIFDSSPYTGEPFRRSRATATFVSETILYTSELNSAGSKVMTV